MKMSISVEQSIVLNGLGQPIPDTPHAVSVSLPTWKAVIGYEEGEDWVLSKMKTGYPRFFLHSNITSFANAIVMKYGCSTEQAFLFPSYAVANRCLEFFLNQIPSLVVGRDIRIVDFYLNQAANLGAKTKENRNTRQYVSAVIFPRSHSQIAKTFWQHSGDGISSRRAEFCHKAFDEGRLFAIHRINSKARSPPVKSALVAKGPRRYQRGVSALETPLEKANLAVSREDHVKLLDSGSKEHVQFIEERFGRNLDTSLASSAKIAIKRRIAGALRANVELEKALEIVEPTTTARQVPGLSEEDVYLFPTGMSSIFNTHRILRACRGELKSICFGFPYIDTLKILEKWGPGCLFYGDGTSADLDDLEARCNNGEKYLAVFCEFPGNPLLKSPDLPRLQLLARRFDFAIVVDETIGNFLNVHVLPFADIVVSSLTKVFSGDSNVMGGSAILNPKCPYYEDLREKLIVDFEDNYWAEDAIFMERNSRDFVSRIERINNNAEAICTVLRASPIVKEVYYPKFSPTRSFYDHCRNPDGGYGGLLSVIFTSTVEAVTFFDALDTAKGPSLGTNFTISCPYVMLAHYSELDWCAKFGIEPDLVRISVGLEDTLELSLKCERALLAASDLSFRLEKELKL